MALTKVTSGIRTLATDEVTTDIIEDGTVTNAKIKSDAAIEASKLESTLDLSGKTVTLPAASVTAHVTQFDDNQLKEEIALLGFRTAANGSLAKYNLVDQTIDAFEDASGIDTSASIGEQLSGGAFAGAVGNYYGDGSDGALSTADNVTYTVANKNGSYDGDMVIKQYSSLTVNTGHTITTDQPCRGLFIYVSGDCTINGTISMTTKGANADPTASGGSDSNAVSSNGLQIGLLTTGGSSSFTNDGTGFNGCGTAVRTAIANQGNISSNGTIYTISQLGSTGGAGAGSPGDGGTSYGSVGTAGTTGGATISTAGGGGGTTHDISGGGAVTLTGGTGGRGGAFSGGAGGGGAQSRSHSGKTGGNGGDYGGAGGSGPSEGGYNGASGGSGNPGGGGSNGGQTGGTGVGGIILLIVGGNLTIGGTGVIEATGVAAGTNSSYAFGGGSGGGAIHVLYKETLSNSGSITATNGGSGATAYNNGGTGGVNTAQLGQINQDMTLISNATTAEAVPTKGDLVMTYTNGAGIATINTDLKAYASRDNGTTWTQMTLASQGSTGAHTILSAHDLDISGQPSGTDMRYKITTHNQSVTKETRVHAVSLGWS
jgi:hypothetical protein